MMQWWLLLVLIGVAWSLWAVACSCHNFAEDSRNPLPNGERRGFSCFPFVPIFPLLFWGAALLIDWIAEPWGTWIIGLLHTVFAVLLLASIVKCSWQLWSIEKPR